MSDDPKLSERYRELPSEEPPRALDERILAASRRAVRRRRGWYGPVAAAAVITLAVAVTLHIQHDRPSEEVDAVSPAMKVQETPAPSAAEAPKPARRAPQPFAAQAPAPAAPPAAQAERRRNDAGAASAGTRESRDEARLAKRAVTPEAELERIAELRRRGEHEEADKALAEFRKRYPEYVFSDEMKAKVERR